MEEKNYIFPIFGCNTDIIGQGFIADGYFITAAHVLSLDPTAYIVLKGKTIILAKETIIVKTCPQVEGNIVSLDENSPADVAIFNFKGVSSPLHLSEYVPCGGDEVISLCVFDNHNNDLWTKQPDEVAMDYILSEEKGVAMPDRMGKYFGCVVNRRSTSSGSPLLIGNDVVGIMNSGHDNDICVYLSAKSIVDLLKS